MVGEQQVTTISRKGLQGSDDLIYLSAITSGGSQAMFMKLNTFGEEAFLEKLEAVLDRN